MAKKEEEGSITQKFQSIEHVSRLWLSGAADELAMTALFN